MSKTPIITTSKSHEFTIISDNGRVSEPGGDIVPITDGPPNAGLDPGDQFGPPDPIGRAVAELAMFAVTPGEDLARGCDGEGVASVANWRGYLNNSESSKTYKYKLNASNMTFNFEVLKKSDVKFLIYWKIAV